MRERERERDGKKDRTIKISYEKDIKRKRKDITLSKSNSKNVYGVRLFKTDEIFVSISG